MQKEFDFSGGAFHAAGPFRTVRDPAMIDVANVAHRDELIATALRISAQRDQKTGRGILGI